MQVHSNTPQGCDGLKTLARDRRTLRWFALRMGLPSASSEFMLDFWQSPPTFCKHTMTNGAVDFPLISRQFSITFRLFSVSFCVRRAFSKHFEQDLRKSGLRGPTVNMKIEVFGDFWDPAGAEKSTKNGPAAEKMGSETAPEPIFCVFTRRCRSESV